MPLTKVSSGVIAANAVVDSFGTQSITGDKLGLTAINANNIVGGAVTGDKIGATSINANNIVNASITGAKLAATTITGDKLTVGQITGNLIATNAISQNNIVSVNASVATVGTLPKARLPSNSVLQVVSTTKTDKFTTTSITPVDITGLSVTITPISANSRILIVTNMNYGGDSNLYGAFFVVRNSTNVVVGTYPTGNQTVATFGVGQPFDTFKIDCGSHTYLDSPGLTSAITYKVQAASAYNSLTFTINAPFQTADQPYIIGGTSTITVMEIAG